MALQQQHLLSSQKDVVPEEQLAMQRTPRVKSDGDAPVPPELQAMKRAEERAREYSVACVANDRAPIGLVVKQTLARASTLDLTKCDARLDCCAWCQAAERDSSTVLCATCA
jgi:hypothetical protein